MKGPLVREQKIWAGWEAWCWRLCLGALGLFFLAVMIQKIWSFDTWWQMATGRWILEHRALPTHDEFSYTVPAHPWIEMRWVYCILAYTLWQLGGATLLILTKTVALGAAFAVVIWPNRRALS